MKEVVESLKSDLRDQLFEDFEERMEVFIDEYFESLDQADMAGILCRFVGDDNPLPGKLDRAWEIICEFEAKQNDLTDGNKRISIQLL
jgi:hypothetical protein